VEELRPAAASAFRMRRLVEGDVVDDVQVEVGVTVEIGEGGAGAPGGSRVLRAGGESPLAIVEVPAVRTEVGDEDVGGRVAVDVGADRPLTVAAVPGSVCLRSTGE